MSGEAAPKNRLKKATQKAIVEKYLTAPNPLSHSSEVGQQWRLGGGPLTYLLTQPPIPYFGNIIWMYGNVKKQPILEMVDGFDNFG